MIPEKLEYFIKKACQDGDVSPSQLKFLKDKANEFNVSEKELHFHIEAELSMVNTEDSEFLVIIDKPEEESEGNSDFTESQIGQFKFEKRDQIDYALNICIEKFKQIVKEKGFGRVNELKTT